MVLQTEFAQIKGNDLYIDDVKATDLVKQYGTWTEYNAVDKTSLREMLYGRIDKIIKDK